MGFEKDIRRNGANSVNTFITDRVYFSDKKRMENDLEVFSKRH